MTPGEVTRKLLENAYAELAKPETKDRPAWVQHGLAMIRRAAVYQRADPIVSVQPMTKPLGMKFYQEMSVPRWEPSAVNRLGALAEPDGELAKKIAEWDERHTYNPKTFDMVADPSVPGAVP